MFCRTMKKDMDYRCKIRKTGGGRPEATPEPSEEMALAESLIGPELMMGDDAFETFTSPSG